MKFMGCGRGLDVTFRQKGAWGSFEKVVSEEQMWHLEDLNLLRTQEGVVAPELWQ